MSRMRIHSALRNLGLFLCLLAAACQRGEVIAPDGSTISISASPASIVLTNGVQDAPVTVLATVRNSIGTPLPGQDVRFNTTSGDLTPTAGTPVPTDDFGNATSVLKNARTNTTITAQSGKASQTLQLQTATCAISAIGMDPTTLVFTSCAPPTPITVTATVTDTNGKPCQGILVSFKSTVTQLPTTDVTLTFSPGSNPTDADGQLTTTVGLGADCSNKCPNKDCNTSNQGIVASGGGISSQPVAVTINVSQ